MVKLALFHNVRSGIALPESINTAIENKRYIKSTIVKKVQVVTVNN